MLATVRGVINGLPRRVKSLMLVAFDAAALMVVLWASYQLRLGGTFRPSSFQLLIMACAPLIALPIFLRFGLYRAVIRYLPDRAIWTIVQAMGVATMVWVFVLFIAEATRFAVFPRSVPIFYFLLGVVVIAGARFAAKWFLWGPQRPQTGPATLIYGAGDAGRQLATALRNERQVFVAGLLDDDTALQGRDVAGLRVHSPVRLPTLIEDYNVSEVILSMPSIDAARRQAIVTDLSKQPVKIRTLPAISEIVSGKYLVGQLREIDIDDLLGRSSIPADPALLKPMIEGRSLMVTGGGGSIGSELCRIAADWGPRKLVLYEANEFALYRIDRALRESGTACEIVPVLGSVRDEALLRRTLAAHDIDVVIHAAAHKHVPLVEANAAEGVRNNVLGTRTVAEAAFAGGVSNFILVSTDKAVRPTNVMGATKRWAELIVREIGERAVAAGTGQRFCAVRFGNVLGSTGSVVPLFREQIAAGGPVTLTDERMTRYFMSIHEAAELIIQAGTLSEGGDLFLLDMGKPVLIRDLAENMIRLAGLSIRDATNPDGDIAIETVGVRAGEKLFEELFYDPAAAEVTPHPKIMRASMSRYGRIEGLAAALDDLTAALERNDEAELRRVLFAFIA